MLVPMAPTAPRPAPPGLLARARKRLAAWLVARGSANHARRLAARRAALFAPLAGRVLELGPGAGTNRDELPAGVRWLGIEPNPYMIEAFRAGHDPAGLVAGRAEALPFATGSLDAVFCTLVLCSVADPPAVLAEIRRVLRPGGRFAFLEHCRAHAPGPTRLLQRLVRPAWCWLADGCTPDRDVAGLVAAAGFARLDLERFDLALPLVGPHVAGSAWA